MVKKKKNRVLIGSIIIILSVVAIFSLVAFNSDGLELNTLAISSLDSDVGQCSGGWTTLSIDDVNIQKIGDRIRVFGVAKGSECLAIKLNKYDLNDKLEDEGLEATRDITGSVRLLEYTKTFPIDRQTDISGEDSTYKSIEVGNFNVLTEFTICSINSCKSRISEKTIDTFSTGLVSQTCNCIYPGGQGIVGDFSSARAYGNFEVEFNIGGDTATLSREQQAVSIGDHDIEWVGNLVNLDEVFPPQYDARLIYSNWELANDGALSRVEQEFSDFKNCFESGYQTSSDFSRCKVDFDNDVANILQNKLEKYKSDMSNVIYDANTDANNLYVTLKATPFPAFILDLDAESVGIIQLVGKPKITSCIESQSYQSGQNEVLQFSVKNDVAIDNVQFYANVECDDGLTGFVPNFYIDGLQDKTISVELHPTNPDQGSLNVNCKLTVSDLKSGNSDDCNFFGTVEYESGIICEPNSFYCDDVFENVIKCTADGKNKVVYETCQYGCEVVAGQGKCREEEPPVPSGFCEDCDAYAKGLFFGWASDSISCKDKTFQGPFFCIFAILKLLAIPFLFVFSLILGFNAIDKIMKGEYKVLSWSLAIVLGGIIGVLTYFFFYVGVVIFILIAIVRFFIGFIPGLNLPKRRRR